MKTETTETANPVVSQTNTAASQVNQPQASRRNRFTVIAGVVVAIAAGLAFGVIPRVRAQGKLAAASREIPHPTVMVTNVSRLASSVQLSLPGDVRAFEETRIYARADGYLL